MICLRDEKFANRRLGLFDETIKTIVIKPSYTSLLSNNIFIDIIKLVKIISIKYLLYYTHKHEKINKQILFAFDTSAASLSCLYSWCMDKI